MTSFEDALREALEELGLAPSREQVEQLCRHFALLQHWNRRMNLTGIGDPAEIARRHFGESAFVHAQLPAAKTLVDVGSGAGFPGLPVAVLRPATSVVLVESKRRKAAFLREASRGNGNVTVACCRIADWPGTADWALVRAVAAARVLPDLEGRVTRVAVLGTQRPSGGGPFRRWQSQAVPWSNARRLWTGKAV